MNIKKIGHCCLLIKTGNLTILTDPGTFTTAQDEITGVDIVLITHEHADHMHVDSVKKILKNNPQAKVISNSGVGAKLKEAGVPFSVLEGTSAQEISGVRIEASDGRHGEIFKEIGQVQNTGYFIDTLFYPGDSFHNPGKPVEILALPVVGPWCKLADAIYYAIDVAPKKAFPVHDAMLKAGSSGFMNTMLAQILKNEKGIEFVGMGEGDEKEF